MNGLNEIIGTISLLKVNATAGDSYALFEIMDNSTTPPTPEVFFIWYEAADSVPPTGPTWMQRSLQVSLVRDAITSGKQVVADFPAGTGSIVSSLGLVG